MSDNTNVVVANINSDPFVEKINKERDFLHKKREELNKIIDLLEKDVVDDNTDKPKYSNARNMKAKSASERMELIKAYVELQKATIGIGKDIMMSHEKEFKMKLEGVRLAHTINKNENQAESTNSMSPTEVKKMLKQMKLEGDK